MFGFKPKLDPNSEEAIIKRRKEAISIIEKEMEFPNIPAFFANNDRVDALIKHLKEGTDDGIYCALCMLSTLQKSDLNLKKMKNASQLVQQVK